MAKVDLNTIKNWFKTGLKPTQEQFFSAWDSFWHKDDTIPASNIEDFDIYLSEKADKEALNNHINDAAAHDALFQEKVDKEDGKGLSTNDFTDVEKEMLNKSHNDDNFIPGRDYQTPFSILDKNDTPKFNVEDSLKFDKYFDIDEIDKEISLFPKVIIDDDERVIKATYNPTSAVQVNANASTGENTEAESIFYLVNNSVFSGRGLAIIEYIGYLNNWSLPPNTGIVPSRIYLELYLTTTNSLICNKYWRN